MVQANCMEYPSTVRQAKLLQNFLLEYQTGKLVSLRFAQFVRLGEK